MVKSEKEHVLLWRLFKVKCFYAWILLFSTMQLIYAAVCNVNFDVRSKWSDGFVVDVVLQNNTDTTMRNWQVVWQGVPFSVSNIWRAILAGSNNDTLYIHHQSYNQNIYPYNIETFGFTGQGSFHLPNYFAINGFSCSINGQSPEKDTTPPGIPSISYTDLKSNQVEIHWQAVTDDQTPEDEISYEVFLNDQLITTFSGTSYLINTLKPGNNYKIYIKAVDLSGNRSVSNVLNITTLKIDQICDYDVSKDQFQVVNEYQTTAVSGWYSDTFSTPVTTVDGVIYFVYITPGFKVKVGKIFNGFVEEYYVDSDVSINNDAHNEFSIAVDKQGYIHIAGGAHNSSLYYWRSAKPYDVSNFVEYPNAMPGNAFTYNFFRVDNNGELYMVSRVQAKSPWWQVGGRGVGLYHYDLQSKIWQALGALAPEQYDGKYKVIIWENSGENGSSYQRYKADMRFDKNNRMYITVPINADNASNIFNYVITAYSDDGGHTFKKRSSATISPLPMRIASGSAQADVIDGYYNAAMSEHANILLDDENNPAIYFGIDGETWYRYAQGDSWSTRQRIFDNKQCSRCFTLSDQDNGVMSLIDYNKWYRFTDYGMTMHKYQISVPILRWDLRALKEAHTYRGVYWNSKTGQWNIYRVDVSNPTKCF